MNTEQCKDFLKSLKLLANFAIMAKALLRPLSLELMEEALEHPHSHVSPRDNCMDAKFSKTFAPIFCPVMLAVVQDSFASRYDYRCLGLINSIPKIAGMSLGVKRKSLIFFYLALVAYLFFFLGVSRVWKKKTRKCMVHDLRFFCDLTYTLKKKLRNLRFKKKASYAFFIMRPMLFLIRDLRQKKINK